MTRTTDRILTVAGGVVLALIVSIALGSDALAPSLAPASSVLPSGTPAAPVAGTAMPEVDGDRALAHVRFFADPGRGGRFTASAGYEAAARYTADRFAEIGLEPWGDGGTYFHHFRMPLVDLAATPELTVTGPGGKAYRHRVDFTERVGGTFGSGSGEGRLVFIGAGTPSDLEQVEVRGKVALVITGGRTDPAHELAARGAAGAIYVSTAIIKYSYVTRFETATIPALVVTPATADELLAPSGKRVEELAAAVRAQLDPAASPRPPSPAFELPVGVRVSVPLTPVRDVDAFNVVGLLRGSDPDAAKRAVLVGGHLDGVGTDPDGTVFPAANDNASGPAVTIEVARALAPRKAELRSSVVFVAWAGEEQGLRGSDAFAAQFAAIPGRRESLLGYVNLDVVGCCGSTIAVSQESQDMVARVRRAAEALGVTLTTGGGSSDQASFARRGVPSTLIIWADIGIIHTTADRIENVTAGRLRTAGRIAADVALELARGG